MSLKPLKKAVLPVAGLGTRFLPATKTMAKEMLPIVDKPLVQYAVEEAVAAGAPDAVVLAADTVVAVGWPDDNAGPYRWAIEFQCVERARAVVFVGANFYARATAETPEGSRAEEAEMEAETVEAAKAGAAREVETAVATAAVARQQRRLKRRATWHPSSRPSRMARQRGASLTVLGMKRSADECRGGGVAGRHCHATARRRSRVHRCAGHDALFLRS